MQFEQVGESEGSVSKFETQQTAADRLIASPALKPGGLSVLDSSDAVLVFHGDGDAVITHDQQVCGGIDR